MNVWIMHRLDGESGSILGVYASPEAAKGDIARVAADFATYATPGKAGWDIDPVDGSMALWANDYDYVSISPFEVKGALPAID